MTVDEFVRSMLLVGKCVPVRLIVKAGTQLGFTREEIHQARERDPNIEVYGGRNTGCWRR